MERDDVYLDHAASSPLSSLALEAMLPWLSGPAANPSGAHARARAARRAVDDARDRIAAVVGCRSTEVVFTSGGTEADNLAVLGVAARRPGAVACSAIEHPAVLEAVRSLDDRPTIELGVDRSGRLDLDELARRLPGDAALVSVMAVNNEVGTIQPVVEAAAAVRAAAPEVVVHTDAIQAPGWVDLRPRWEVVDLLSLSAHKFGGPQGVGALVVRTGTPLGARQLGGSQELGRRAGTPSVAAIVAMGVALAEADAQRTATVARVAVLRDRLILGIDAAIDGVVELGVADGDRSHKVAANAHLCIEGVASEELLFLLDQAGVRAAAASSCASGAHAGSHVVAALGATEAQARGAIRFSLGATTTEAEVERAVEVVVAAVGRLRGTAS